jgi:hypothetical protein
MSIRFRKRVRLLPGVRINIGNRGISSVSFGGRGLSETISRRGIRSTVSLPGTGLSYSSSTPYHPRSSVRRPKVTTTVHAIRIGLLLFAGGCAFSGYWTEALLLALAAIVFNL